MKRLAFLTALLVAGPALAVDTGVYPQDLDRSHVEVPQSWFTSNSVELATGYLYQKAKGTKEESDGLLLGLRSVSSLPAGLDLAASVTAYKLKDVLSDEVKLATGHLGLGFLANIHPWFGLRPEVGAYVLSAKGTNLGFPNKAEAEVQPYGRLEAVTRLAGENDFKVYAQYSSDVEIAGASFGWTNLNGRHALVLGGEYLSIYDAKGFNATVGYRFSFDR